MSSPATEKPIRHLSTRDNLFAAGGRMATAQDRFYVSTRAKQGCTAAAGMTTIFSACVPVVIG